MTYIYNSMDLLISLSDSVQSVIIIFNYPTWFQGSMQLLAADIRFQR